MKKSFSKIIGLTARPAIFLTFLIAGVAAEAAPLSEARVSQVIQDVRMLPSNAASRPATVNDKVTEGTAVRTGVESRAELTFTDLTITRLGANTVFSLNGAREIDLTHGSVLVQVPSNGAPAKVTTAAVTAAISGGTALFGTGPPVKFMVLEGVGTFYPAGHPELAVTLHGGEMVMLTADGHITKPQTFDVKAVVETSALIVGFPDLANLPLILQVMDQQQVDQSTAGSSPPPSKDITDVTSQNADANPALSPPPPSSSPPSEFGPPTTITSPDPYVITSGTTITTDPTITTGGVTNFGTLYRGTALDGSPTEFLFGEAPTVFDQLVFNGSQNNLPIAVFKFADLELTGDPTITVPSGATTNLALVSVGNITSGSPGGTLTFAGIMRLDFITQNGSINLGSDISFSGIDHLSFYARGASSNLTLASPISGGSVVKLFSQGTVQVNGNISVTNEFQSISGGDFLAGSGVVTATNIDIASITGNINIDASQFANPADNTGSVVLNAANTLSLNIDRGGGFGWSSLDAQATTINVTSSIEGNTFDFGNATVLITAGSGGFQAPTIDFIYRDLILQSAADINIGSATFGGEHTNAAISAGTSFSATGNVDASTLTAGTTIDVGGRLFIEDTLTAGGNINVGNFLQALNINAPAGVLTVNGGIYPVLEMTAGAALQHTFNVDSIVSPNGIDFSGNQFDGINGLSSGGLLTINANTLTFDKATGIAFANFNGADAGAFGTNSPPGGGDGGTFIVNANGNIIANNGAGITATTGNNASGDNGFYGAGGTVKLISSGGSVTVDDTIQVSSDDPIPGQTPPPPIRRSASGGTILLQSNLTTGTGITVGSNGQLLSLLDANAPGPGGSITLSTMGADITVNGIIEADLGTITIDQNDPAGSTPMITIDGATLTSETLNITGAGDVNIGLTTPATINAVTIALSAANNLNWSGGTLIATATNSDGNVNISAGQAINITNDLDIEQTNNGRTSGLNVTLNAGTTLSVGGNLSLTTDASDIGTGGNIVVTSGGDMTIGGAFTLFISAASGSTTGVGGNINVTSGGSLTAGSLDFDLFFDPSAQVTNGENLTLTVTKDLITTSGGVTLVLSTPVGPDRPPLLNGGNVSMTIGGNLVLASGGDLDLEMINSGITNVPIGGNIFASVGGNLSANQINASLTNFGDSIIGTGGNLTFSVGGNMTASSVTLDIDNSSNGAITTGGNLNFHVGGDANLGNFALSIDNSNGGVISSGGDITASIGGSLTTSSLSLSIDNSAGGQIGGSGNMSLTTVGDLTTSGGGVNFTLQNTGGAITDGGNITLTVGGNVSTQGLSLILENYDFSANPAGSIGTGGNLSATVSGNLAADYVDMFIGNRSGGMIGSGGNITLAVNGALTTTGDAGFIIETRFDSSINGSMVGSTIGSSVTLEVSAASVDIGGSLAGTFFNPGSPFSGISNRGSTIDGSATYIWAVSGDMTVQGEADMEILNDGHSDSGADGGGTIHGSATLQVNANDFTANSLFAQVNNRNGGVIDSNAILTFNLTGNFATPGTNPGNPNAFVSPGDAVFYIRNQQNSRGTAGGSIGGAATLTINAADMSVAGDFDAEIQNQRGSGAPGPNGGSIGTDAALNVTATSLSVGGEFDAVINNQNNGSGSGAGGSIGGSATINLSLSGDLAITGTDSNSGGIAGDAYFVIFNANLVGGSGGFIGSDATIAISAANISTAGVFDAEINNYNGGQIGGSATIDITTVRALVIGDVLPSGNINADYMYVSIDNTGGGSIGSDATINMNVGGTATVTNDATVQILGNDPTGSAAINFNGGDYEVGGTFLSTIDGNGTIAFNSTTVNADTLKAGVFGPNGKLMIGGGSLSANTLMKLYATGSNGAIDFTASVTLTCKAAAIILAANTVTINDNVVVTIAGGFSASVYANIANYSASSGGNGTTTGTFAGNGATTSSSPPPAFNDSPPSPALSSTSTASASTKTQSSVSTNTKIASSGNVTAATRGTRRSPSLSGVSTLATSRVTSTKTTTTTPAANTIKVSDSGQLLSMLDSATPSANGKIMITSSKGDGVSNNPTRLNAASGSSHDRSAPQNQSSSKTSVALLDHTPPSVR